MEHIKPREEYFCVSLPKCPAFCLGGLIDMISLGVNRVFVTQEWTFVAGRKVIPVGYALILTDHSKGKYAWGKNALSYRRCASHNLHRI